MESLNPNTVYLSFMCFPASWCYIFFFSPWKNQLNKAKCKSTKNVTMDTNWLGISECHFHLERNKTFCRVDAVKYLIEAN